MKPPRKQESHQRKYRPGTVKRILKAKEELDGAKRMPFDPADKEDFLRWLREGE